MRTLLGRAGPLLIFAPSRLPGPARPIAEPARAPDDCPGETEEDLWDPTGVPLDVVLPGRAWLVRWRFRSAGRR